MNLLMRSSRALTVALGLVVLPVLGGCVLPADNMCSEGEEPLYATGNPNGKVCIDEDEDVPDGFARYPENRVPQKVGDEYDRWPLAEDYPWADEV